MVVLKTDRSTRNNYRRVLCSFKATVSSQLRGTTRYYNENELELAPATAEAPAPTATSSSSSSSGPLAAAGADAWTFPRFPNQNTLQLVERGPQWWETAYRKYDKRNAPIIKQAGGNMYVARDKHGAALYEGSIVNLFDKNDALVGVGTVYRISVRGKHVYPYVAMTIPGVASEPSYAGEPRPFPTEWCLFADECCSKNALVQSLELRRPRFKPGSRVRFAKPVFYGKVNDRKIKGALAGNRPYIFVHSIGVDGVSDRIYRYRLQYTWQVTKVDNVRRGRDRVKHVYTVKQVEPPSDDPITFDCKECELYDADKEVLPYYPQPAVTVSFYKFAEGDWVVLKNDRLGLGLGRIERVLKQRRHRHYRNSYRVRFSSRFKNCSEDDLKAAPMLPPLRRRPVPAAAPAAPPAAPAAPAAPPGGSGSGSSPL